jgi:uncharacterized protein YjbI with pentapeptide repeats
MAMTKEEIRFALEAHAKHKTGQEGGKRLELFKEDLRGIELSGMNLEGATFIGCDMRGLDLRGCKLSFTNYHFSDMRNTDFRGTRGIKLDFEGADLRDANLQQIDIAYGGFQNADIRGVRFDGSRIAKSDFHNAHVTGEDFKGATIQESYLPSTGYFEEALREWPPSSKPVQEALVRKGTFKSAELVPLFEAGGGPPLLERLEAITEGRTTGQPGLTGSGGGRGHPWPSEIAAANRQKQPSQGAGSNHGKDNGNDNGNGHDTGHSM